MTKKKTDPEWTPEAKAGEIVSQLSQLGEKIKLLVSDLVKPESKVVKRGVLEIRAVSDSYVASFQNVAPVEVNGYSIPGRPGNYVRGVGADPYEAVKSLALEMKASEAKP